jgi:hypothetical protein
MVMSPAGLGPEKDSAGEAQQQLYTIDPSSRQRDMIKQSWLKLEIRVISSVQYSSCYLFTTLYNIYN